MRVAYVSGPYRAQTILGVMRNIWRARKVAIKLWKAGYAVICPHLNTAFFPQGAAFAELEGEDHIGYIRGDLAIVNRLIPRYDMMVILPGWENSVGAREEFLVAIKRELIIRYWDFETGKFKIFRQKENNYDSIS